MNRCSKCNNELIERARFCNICGTPVPGAPETPPAPDEPVGLKRTIKPEVRRVRPARTGRAATDSLLSDMTPVEAGAPDTAADGEGSDASETKAAKEETKSAPRPSTPVIPKTTMEFTTFKGGPGGEKQKLAPPAASTEQEQTVPLPPPPEKILSLPSPAPDETIPLPPPNVGVSRAPGIIRPIVSSAALRQNTPLPPGQTPPNPMSPLPALPDTPTLPVEKPRQMDNTRLARPLNMQVPGSPVRDTQRQADGPQSLPVPARQHSPDKNVAGQPNRFNGGALQTPRPALQDMPTDYLAQEHANGNGTGHTATRQELPLFSPESFAYTSKAAQHWRNSWRDLQNAEAGPAQDVSKGQAEVAAPLASRKDSFLRMRAIRSKQHPDGGEKNFGFWVTLFLMICLIGGLAAYIVYSYLPNSSTALRLSQPGGASQPTFSVVGGPTNISRGQSLRAHGTHFGANDPIQFLLDSTTPILASTGSPLSAQSDGQGAFDVTILAGKDWAIGAHVISATDTRASLSAYLDIQINPSGSPVSGNNNPYLAFMLNGQSIDQLSFTAQLGQSAPAAERITFTNISGAPLQWTAASTTHNLNWLTIVDNDYAGQLSISQPHSMGISVNPAGLNVTGNSVTDPENKPYTGQIVFTINGNTQLTLGVQLTIVNATPELVFSPNPLVATEIGSTGTCQPGATLTFINLGTTVISWTANPDRQDKIWFVDSSGKKDQQGILQPSGMDGDTAVVTLQCSGVKVGDKYNVNVYVNKTNTPFTETVQIGG